MLFNFEKTLYFLIGFIAFSLSFTSLREMGFGRSLEILFFLLVITAIGHLIHYRKINFNLSFVPLIFFLFFLGPLTFLNSFQEFPGSSIETLFALILASITGFAISQSSSPNMTLIAYGLGLCSLTILFVLLSSGFSVDGITRFSALSKNPNQLALYSLASLIIVTIFMEHSLIRSIFIILLILCGALALSDAFFLAIAVGLFFYIFSKSVVSSAFLFFGLPAIIILITISFLWINIFYDGSIIETLYTIWREADQGGTRSSLYMNGIIAFSYSPFLGYGGGAFAGISIPFEKYEAHNTLIDFATMGGIFLPIIFYFPFVIGFFSSLKKDSLQHAAISAFIAFSMFHFVGRHPIVWMAWGACLTLYVLNKHRVQNLQAKY